MEKPAVKPKLDASSAPRRSFPLTLALVLAAGLAAGLAAPAWAQVPRTPEEQRKADEAAAQAAKEIAAKQALLNAQNQKIDAAAQAAGQKGAAGTVLTQPGAAGQAPITSTGRGRATPGQPAGTGATGGAPRIPGQAPGGLRVEGDGGATGAANDRALGPDEAELPAASEAIELKTLVEYVADTLQINIAGNDSLTGSVVLNAPVVVKKSELLRLLGSLLEQQDFMITKDDTGWYKVIPNGGVVFSSTTGELATTRVIPTPTVKPSSLAQAINEQLGVQAKPARLSFMDELGVIVATDSPRHLDALSSLIAGILERNSGMEFRRFDLVYVAPSVARQRLLDMLGQASGTNPQQIVINAGGQGQQGLAGQATSNITNIADRLTADASSSALIFRGYPEEFARAEQLLTLIDRPNTLHYKQYFAGSGAAQIAQLAERLGLGHVELVDASNQPQTTQPNTAQFAQQPNNRNNNQNQLLQNAQQQNASIGGPVMIVDTVRSTIIYYGTDSQQAQLDDLISKFDTDREQVVIVTYKLKNKPADVVADTLNSIAFNQNTSSGNNSFLPGQNGGFFGFNSNPFGTNNNNNSRTNSTSSNRTTGSTTSRGTGTGSSSSQNRNNPRQSSTGFRSNQPGSAQASAPDTNDPLGGPEVFILADTSNGQVIVKAPARQQEEFAKVIAKLDQRSPQVQIEVQIVAVTANDDFRLTFETQLQAGQFNANTNWAANPLGSLATGTGAAAGSDLRNTKQVSGTLPGFTSALIKSSYVPIVMNALKTNTDTRIVASPFILVDDNVEAEIVSLDEQPTSTTTQGTATTNTSFGGYEEAGTTLTVTPSISEGGYLRLMYEIELSNFVGSPSAAGFPPAKQTRNIRSDSVTIPGDATIVVGGITATNANSTIAKIPLLGNIPLLGYLFRDTSLTNTSTRLYVFITPRIFRDTNFRDPILYTIGPRADAGIAPDYPDLKPALIEIIGADARPAEPSAEPQPKQIKKKQENHRLWPDPHAD